ncbi:EGF-like domain protein [Teladorsagia circumcincta]|uniref:EGF-like domain protein n=1 Tax=Teladorsagia circumcincta TaxID=45464 RepID=A0A2G9TFB8_TELCI|nr:EGF-like domain protein [Teladorsagia circumcincta]
MKLYDLQGPTCEDRCALGFFGKNCSKLCDCLNNNKCDSVTGKCLCVGWMGEKCERGCPRGFYGPMCSKKCELCNGISWTDSNAACDPVTGACKCERGYKGPDCKQRVCDEDMYGQDCSKQCTCIMENTESCAPDTGYCRCKPGFAGDSCERICSKLFWGRDCANKCECDYNVTSECVPTTALTVTLVWTVRSNANVERMVCATNEMAPANAVMASTGLCARYRVQPATSVNLVHLVSVGMAPAATLSRAIATVLQGGRDQNVTHHARLALMDHTVRLHVAARTVLNATDSLANVNALEDLKERIALHSVRMVFMVMTVIGNATVKEVVANKKLENVSVDQERKATRVPQIASLATLGSVALRHVEIAPKTVFRQPAIAKLEHV